MVAMYLIAGIFEGESFHKLVKNKDSQIELSWIPIMHGYGHWLGAYKGRSRVGTFRPKTK